MNEEERLNEAEEYKFTFGKHKGKTIKEVYATDLGYISWLLNSEKTEPRIIKMIELITGEVKPNELQERIDKAIEYIKNNTLFYENYDYNEEDELELKYVYDDKARKDLLEILGGKDEVGGKNEN